MIRNYFKIAWRNLIKNKVYSLINIVGLAIGIAAYLMIIQYVNFESNYDKFQSGINDLYRVTLTTNLGAKGFQTSAANHPTVSPAMKQDFPEVETFTRLTDRKLFYSSFLLTYTDEDGSQVKLNVTDGTTFLADSTALEIFDIPLIKGISKTALVEPRSIVISSDVAKRFFGSQDPLNKSLMVNNWFSVKVTGVFEQLPENTHLQFNMLMSMSTMARRLESWMHPVFYNYVRLKPGSDPAKVAAKFPDFIKKYLGDIMEEHGFEAKMGLQPVSDIHLKSHHLAEISTNASEKTLQFLKIIAVFVILIALINFINLSTAKSSERALEVGLKKVVGIKRSALIGQFLFESLTINLIATLLAVLLVSVLMNPFNQLVGLQILSLDFWLQPQTWMHLIALICLGGILAGAYPAFVLSSFKPVQVLKGKLDQSGKGSLMRKILVVAQFTISIALISGTFIIYHQFSYMQNKDLGFDAEHSLVVYAPIIVDYSAFDNKIAVFKDELLRNPNINSVASTSEVPGTKMRWGSSTRQIYEKKEEALPCKLMSIDQDFTKAFRVKLLGGRIFRPGEETPYEVRELYDTVKSHRVIINKAAADLMGFTSFEEALNKKILFKFGNGDHPAEVIGVLDNFHQNSLQSNFEPIIFINPKGFHAMYVTFNIIGSNVQSTIDAIGIKYEEIFPQDAYKFFFLDDYFNRQYQADLKFGQIFLLFAGLAIVIAILGLFGLGSYMALRKTKELCIRKVLGANTRQVLLLIPKSLLILVLISGLIALPITYYIAFKWLSDYAFRIDLSLWMFVTPLALVMLMAGMSVLPESIKVALLKPADYLRNE